jgi:radical SAM superfamily enzyme YgiQ (UPF0313 family)
MGARISVSSLRVRPLRESLIRALAESGDRTLTLAPEAGSERLRSFIQKEVSRDDILKAVDLARRHGFGELKLYFMIGLPTETEDDVVAIVDLADEISTIFPRTVTVNVTPFVPKAHTPFEREGMLPEKTIDARLELLKRQLRAKGIAMRSDGARWAVVQGVLARGDRDVSLALEHLTGPSPKEWRRACKEVNLEPDTYLAARSPGETLPWHAIIS